MTALIDWLALFTLALAGPFLARWVVGQSRARWQGRDTIAARLFLNALILATLAGIGIAASVVLYYEILARPEFLRLAGAPGLLKGVLILSAVWAGLFLMLRPETKEPGR